MGTINRIRSWFWSGVICLLVCSAFDCLGVQFTVQNTHGSATMQQTYYEVRCTSPVSGSYNPTAGTVAAGTTSAVKNLGSICGVGVALEARAYGVGGSGPGAWVVVGSDNGANNVIALVWDGTGTAGPPAPVYTNYVHCISWTNNTGGYKVGLVLSSAGQVGTELVAVSPGGVFAKCYTNGLSDPPQFCYRPYVGAAVDDYICDSFATTLTNVQTVVVSGTGPQTGVAQASYTNGLTVLSPTNLVGYYSPSTNATGYGTTNPLTQSDLNRLGDALIRALGGALGDVRDAVRAGQGTNGSGADMSGVIDAVRDGTTEVTNSLAGVRSAITNLTDTYGTNVVGTNNFGFGTAESLGTSLHGSANAGWLGDFSNTVSGNITSVVTANEAGLLLNFQDPSSPLYAMSVIDLRPSTLPSAWKALASVIHGLTAYLITFGLYWAMWKDFTVKFLAIESAASGVGKSVTSASVLGSTAGLAVRGVIASIVTVGLAGLPTLVIASMASFNVLNPFASSPVELASSLGSAQSAGVSAAMPGAWALVNAIFPYVTLGTAILNFIGFTFSTTAFITLWFVILRFMPILVIGGLCLSASAESYIIENRLAVPCAVVTGGNSYWFGVGEHYAQLPSSFNVSFGGATNTQTVNATSDEWSRVTVYDTGAETVGVTVTGEGGFILYFTQGFVAGLSLVILIVMVHIAKRAFGVFGGGGNWAGE